MRPSGDIRRSRAGGFPSIEERRFLRSIAEFGSIEPAYARRFSTPRERQVMRETGWIYFEQGRWRLTVAGLRVLDQLAACA